MYCIKTLYERLGQHVVQRMCIRGLGVTDGIEEVTKRKSMKVCD